MDEAVTTIPPRQALRRLTPRHRTPLPAPPALLALALSALLSLLAFPPAASAHLLDEYLQATLVSVEPGDVRLYINLTPGVAVADRVLALLDRDRDGVISADEATAYAELLKRDLTVRLDGRDVELKLAASSVPPPGELRTGMGIMKVEFAAATGPLAAGAHRLTLENRHLPAAGVYLVNAAKPKAGSVRITGQRRNDNQSTGEIEFTVQPLHPPANASAPVASGAAASRAVASRAVGIVALVAAPLVAVFAGVWRARSSAPRRT